MSRKERVAFITAIWLLLLYAGLVHVTRHTWRLAVRDYKLADTPPLVTMNTKFIDILTLGHRGLYDDFIAIWSLQTLMDRRLSGVPADELQKSLLIVTRHEPRIESLYLLSCYILAFDFQRPDLCERIVADGIRALPNGWRIPMLQGFLYYSVLKNSKNATLYYNLAASKENAPPFLKKLAQNLIQKNALEPEDLEALARELLPPRAAQGRLGDALKKDGGFPHSTDRR